ncbi:DNA-binding response regulator, OmpR family, contains REC and winged-helix (wHTH) domain [Anaerocolumna jejuensis DSM 15929]|uniref:Stage 0 sporulation protein A homolog n=1 Tax=Anaerocolumna jejuensis DSM 15929 TaxID=1121322 RepID=A0A1M6M2Z3_9FIRM|nr:response regulator transcription factor [Anaerocolumna jejuensis]SHJ77796.1 DNA-binding response regulator, OmpR family, contains REC and winged-helix (wHTH) domain [Anaerocolumna jejuensis DSM 15929]
MRLLLIEDDIEISDMLRDYLLSEGFEVVTAYDGQEGCDFFLKQPFDLVLLDIMIPKLNGIEVMKKIRAQSIVPIIIMSAKDTDSDKSLGLGLGADDYITKPFSVTEVLARIKANIRRSTQYIPNPVKEEVKLLSAGKVTINPETYMVVKNETEVELTSKEFAILKLLLENPRKVFTKAQLYSMVWEDDYLGDENAVNVHISRLRNKIEDNPREPEYILTVWGIGYKLGNPKE